jgi:TDG/mug DNA glycosylase family protein
MTDTLHVLPDVLCPGLRAVICGTAAGNESARRAYYYASPTNRFWDVLREVGLTPGKLRPEEFRTLPKFSLGLTDIAKFVYGNDATLSPESFDVPSFLSSIRCHRPGIVAFNGKTAARVFYGLSPRADLNYGPGPQVEDFPQIFVLPSTSGSAGKSWDVTWWRNFAQLVTPRSA